MINSLDPITFDEFLEHGKKNAGPHIHDGIPWSFEYKGKPITHEHNNCYLVPGPQGTMRFERGELLLTLGNGDLYPCKLEVFEVINRLYLEIYKLEDERAKREHLLGLIRNTKLQHGTCQPRSRKACTACNSQEELDQILKDWNGFTMTLS